MDLSYVKIDLRDSLDTRCAGFARSCFRGMVGPTLVASLNGKCAHPVSTHHRGRLTAIDYQTDRVIYVRRIPLDKETFF